MLLFTDHDLEPVPLDISPGVHAKRRRDLLPLGRKNQDSRGQSSVHSHAKGIEKQGNPSTNCIRFFCFKMCSARETNSRLIVSSGHLSHGRPVSARAWGYPEKQATKTTQGTGLRTHVGSCLLLPITGGLEARPEPDPENVKGSLHLPFVPHTAL